VANLSPHPDVATQRGVVKPFCSICITHLNDFPTVKQSLESLLNQIDDSFEVVVVDQGSDDGSERILRQYADAGRIQLFEMQTRNRGLGRQLAFQKSRGNYIISHVDLDIFYKPILKRLLDWYRDAFEGKLVMFGSLQLSSRGVIETIGGWRDLQWGEDIEQWARAAKSGLFVDVKGVSVADWTRPFGRGRSRWGTLKYRYEMMRDLRRMGRHRWDKVKDSPTVGGKVVMFMLMVGGTIGSLRKEQYRDPWNNLFTLSDYAYQGRLAEAALE
jgi:glycosyltransferase involved in cell wall biosynthesis